MAHPHSSTDREEVLKTLRKVGPSTVTELMQVAGPERGRRREYRQVLRKLVQEGVVVLDRKGQLTLPKAEPDAEGHRSSQSADRRARQDSSETPGAWVPHAEVRERGASRARLGAGKRRAGPKGAGVRRAAHEPRSAPAEPAESSLRSEEPDRAESGSWEGAEQRQAAGARPSRGSGRVARFEGHRNGFGFVNPADGSRDIFIPPHKTGGALHGDLVEYQVLGTHRTGRREGAVLRVARPLGQRVVGLVTRVSPEIEVVPFDARAGARFLVAGRGGGGVEAGCAVVIEVPRSGSERSARARLTAVLGPITEPGVDIEVLIRKHDLRVDFPDTVTQDAEALAASVPAAELLRREDFSRATVVTIDGETARDFDDAVSVSAGPRGSFELAVHIADVAHYVQRGSATDIEARLRGTSVYFPGRAIPMLPRALSEEICSLKPDVPRLVQSVIMKFDARGEISGVRFADGWIRSRARLTYGQVNALLRGVAPTASERSLLVDLQRMNHLSRLLAERRAARGGLDFDLPEPEVVLDALGAAVGVRPTSRGPAQRLIEEFMISANMAVARFLVERSAPVLHRVHERPDPAKVEEFARVAAAFGHTFPTHAAVEPADFRAFLERIAGRPEERILGKLLLRTMALARYAPQPLGHFGLAAEDYLHFTSPIRRYPDLVAHRALRALRQGAQAPAEPARPHGQKQSLRGKAHSSPKARARAAAEDIVGEDLDLLGAECSRLERTAESAERESLAWKRAEVLMGRLGDEMPGTISWVAALGVFVELEEVYAEGLLPVAALPADRYEFDPTRIALLGATTGKTFKVGQPARVLIARVDRIAQRVELALAGCPGGGVSSPAAGQAQYGRGAAKRPADGASAGAGRRMKGRGSGPARGAKSGGKSGKRRRRG